MYQRGFDRDEAGRDPIFHFQIITSTSCIFVWIFFQVFFESRDLIPKMIPATINPTLAKANTVTIKREFSLAEGSAMALRINSINPMIISIEGK